MSSIERPLIIENPPQNKTPLHHARCILDPAWLEIILDRLRPDITPTTHPKVVELFAADAPLAGFFYDLGWRNFTCIDRAVSRHPLDPEGTVWRYIDLEEMANRIRTNGNLSEVSDLQHQFDIVTATFPVDDEGGLPDALVIPLCNYFVRPNGFIFTE